MSSKLKTTYPVQVRSSFTVETDLFCTTWFRFFFIERTFVGEDGGRQQPRGATTIIIMLRLLLVYDKESCKNITCVRTTSIPTLYLGRYSIL